MHQIVEARVVHVLSCWCQILYYWKFENSAGCWALLWMFLRLLNSKEPWNTLKYSLHQCSRILSLWSRCNYFCKLNPYSFNGLRLLLDQYAPAKKRLVTIRPFAPWYSPIVATEKQKRRHLERKWRKTHLQSDREAYQYQCCVVNELISSLKSTYYTSLINEHSSDQRVLFRTVNKLMQKSHQTWCPPSLSNALLADSFADFFTAKVEMIHTALVARNRELSLADDNIMNCLPTLLN